MPMSEIRINISQANRNWFGGMTHNPLAWPRIFAQILASSSGVWGRNKPEPTALSVIRVERVRDDQRLLFRFVDARTRKDLHLAKMVIEHGRETVRPMTMVSVPMLVTAKEIYEVHGETRYHQAFSANGLRGVFPQARTLVLLMDTPVSVEKLIIGSTFEVDDDEAGERNTASKTPRQRMVDPDANLRRTSFPHNSSDLERGSRVFRG